LLRAGATDGRTETHCSPENLDARIRLQYFPGSPRLEGSLNAGIRVSELASPEQRAQLSKELQRLSRESHARDKEDSERYWAQRSPEERAAFEQQFLAELKRRRDARRAKRENAATEAA
jgi:hypothetical protein